MLLVSLGVADAIHTAVQGFTLHMGADHPNCTRLTAFLRNCRLLRLCVNIPDISCEFLGQNEQQGIHKLIPVLGIPC